MGLMTPRAARESSRPRTPSIQFHGFWPWLSGQCTAMLEHAQGKTNLTHHMVHKSTSQSADVVLRKDPQLEREKECAVVTRAPNGWGACKTPAFKPAFLGAALLMPALLLVGTYLPQRSPNRLLQIHRNQLVVIEPTTRQPALTFRPQ